MTDSLPPDTKLLFGRKLSGRYVLSSMISSGPYTQLWEATDLVLSRKVAVKLTHPELISETAFISKFRSEARNVSRLNHPSILSVLDTTGDDEIEALVMELVEGETLEAHISHSGPLSIEYALSLFSYITDAVLTAHKQGIIHGALSPEKIFLCPDRGIKIMGFGFSESTQLIESSKHNKKESDSIFRSPEQISGALPDHRSDVFSLGKLMLFMISDEAKKLQKGSVPDLINPKIFEAIEKATAGEPTQRYSRVMGFKDELNSANAELGRGTEQTEVGPTGSGTSFDGRRLFTGFLTFGMVFTFVLGIMFATNLDDSLFGSDNNDLSPTPSSQTNNSDSTEASSPDPQTEEQNGAETESTGTEQGPESPSVSPIFEDVSISGARDFDPLGDGVEHPELIANLFDEDESTIWYSETYANRSLGFLKDGVGVVIELEKSLPLEEVVIETIVSGWSGQVYVSETIGANLADWGIPAGTISASQGDATVELTGVSGSAVLIWFTDLGDSPPPGVRMEISEIRVS
tara:strand:+ start:282 stop:1841 length:1560 start_codon:yes stop_codon:yes gene_type:complete